MKVKEIFKKIKQYETIIIAGHIRPDGDCIGSQVGLKEIIMSSFKNKYVYILSSPCRYTPYLGQGDIVKDELFPKALGIIVDTATPERVADQRIFNAKEIIRIDHHIASEEYGDICLLENSPAAAQIIGNFLFQLPELSISKKGAEAIYIGVVTDTGRFRYRGTGEKTHQVAGKMISAGANPAEIDNFISQEDFQVIRYKGYILDNIKTTEKGFIYCKVERNIIKQFGLTDEEAADAVNLMANIKGFPIWALFIQYESEIRVRLRSTGIIINGLAAKYEGGGHPLASGARIHSFDDIPKFCLDVDKLIEENAK